MQFNILNRWSSEIIFTAEIECNENESTCVKLGLAVKFAVSKKADLYGADLRGADLRGANLSDANLCGVNLSGANLSDADLRGANLSGTYLIGTYLRGANFSDADLIGANLSGANFSDADLIGANLSGAILRDAPVCLKIQNIHQAIFNAAKNEGTLDMGWWHSCETTHCRAGWVVHLAGDAGKVLEYQLGTPAAAALIYQLSDPDLEKIPDFYCDNETAMKDMERLSELEKRKSNIS